MRIEVRLHGTYREAAGTSLLTEEMDGCCTLGQLLERLAQRYGGAFRVLPQPDSGGLIIYQADVIRDLGVELEDGACIILVPAHPGG